MPLCAVAQTQTLKESAQQAVLSNPEVLSRWHAFEAANGERDVASGAYLPRLDLASGVGHEKREDSIQNLNFNRNSTTLTLTQMLYDGLATRNDVKRLDHARLVRLFELYDTSENVALEVVRAYADVLRYRKLVSLAEENYVRHRSVFEQIQRKAQAGVGRRVDLEQISGRVALAEANLLTETSNLHDVSARFQRLVGTLPGKDLEVPAALTKGMPTDIHAALNAATQHHPALLAAIENIRSADSSVSARRASYQPRFDLRLRADRGNNVDGISGSSNNNVAEVVMTWNLFNGLSDQSRVRQYADQLNAARDQRDKTCRDVRQTLAIAYNDTRKLTEQLAYLDQHQLSTEKARDAYRKQFDIGQRTLLDLLDTENELFQAKRSYANAEFDLMTAYARTHAGMGTLYGALGLTRQQADALPDLAGQNDTAEVAVNCPAEAPQLYVADKQSLNARAQELVEESASPATVAPEKTLAPAGAEPGVTQERAIALALKGWSDAWANRNIQEYIDAYSATFVPAKGVSHQAWIAQRKARIAGATKIDVDLADIKIVILDQKRASTTFRQSYRSSSYQDLVQKTLEWEEIGGRWLIVKETAEAVGK